MVTRTLDFTPDLPNDARDRLAYALWNADPDEVVTCVVNRNDAHQTGGLIDVLEDNGYTVETKGGHGDEFSIIGRK